MTEARPPVYADENIDARIIDAVRARGFDVLTAGEAAMLGRSDEAQLAYAATIGRVFLTFDRGDFRRLHVRWRDAGREHVGIALLPQSRVRERTVVRACMLLDWLATLGPVTDRLVNSNELQLRLHFGEDLTGYGEDEVRIALGQAAG